VFAGESQANRKYLAFAAKADQEGFTQTAKLFRVAATPWKKKRPKPVPSAAQKAKCLKKWINYTKQGGS
jgi:rubrerythrin